MTSNTSILLFGDSVARGVILDDTGSYRPVRDSFVANAARTLGYSLIDRSRFGCTVSKGRELVTRYLAGKDKPGPDSTDPGRQVLKENTATSVRDEATGSGLRLALLEFGGNDCAFDWPAVAKDPSAPHLPATPPARFALLYMEMIELLRSRGIEPVMLTLPPIDPDRYFNWVTQQNAEPEAVLSWLGNRDRIYLWHERYNAEVWSVALRSGCPVVDIRTRWLERSDWHELLCADGMHPNIAGQKLMEEALVDAGRALEEASSGSSALRIPRSQRQETGFLARLKNSGPAFREFGAAQAVRFRLSLVSIPS